MGFYYYNYQTMLYLLPAILLTLYAQVKLNSTFRKYSQIPTSKGLTGAEAAAEVARLGGANIVVRQIGGNLTDNFDPRNNTISLSQGVYGNTSIAAVGRDICPIKSGQHLFRLHRLVPGRQFP
jgi:hypothetical protein